MSIISGSILWNFTLCVVYFIISYFPLSVLLIMNFILPPILYGNSLQRKWMLVMVLESPMRKGYLVTFLKTKIHKLFIIINISYRHSSLKCTENYSIVNYTSRMFLHLARFITYLILYKNLFQNRPNVLKYCDSLDSVLRLHT